MLNVLRRVWSQLRTRETMKNKDNFDSLNDMRKPPKGGITRLLPGANFAPGTSTMYSIAKSKGIPDPEPANTFEGVEQEVEKSKITEEEALASAIPVSDIENVIRAGKRTMHNSTSAPEQHARTQVNANTPIVKRGDRAIHIPSGKRVTIVRVDVDEKNGKIRHEVMVGSKKYKVPEESLEVIDG